MDYCLTGFLSLSGSLKDLGSCCLDPDDRVFIDWCVPLLWKFWARRNVKLWVSRSERTEVGHLS